MKICDNDCWCGTQQSLDQYRALLAEIVLLRTRVEAAEHARDNELLAYKARAEGAESLLRDVQQECIALRRPKHRKAVALG